MPDDELHRMIARAKKRKATELNLSAKGLTSLPRKLGRLTNLQRLYLHNNQLTALPPEIARWTNLQWLTLAKNQLTALPPEVAQWTNLQTLALHNNQLTALPREVAQWTNLQRLYLDHNQLTALPRELARLTNLEELRLDGNPLESPPPEIVKQGTQAVLAYLRELAKGARKRYEAKLLILGHGGEGKTCVSRALRGLPFKENIRTEGVEVARWTFDHPLHTADDSRKITLNVWDFEGQEINHQSHQFFLTENALYLLVINGRRAFEIERAEYWLDTIRARAPESRVILVASECENTTPSWPLDKLKANYGDLLQGPEWYFVVGCESRKAIDELAAEIQSAAAQMKIMGGDWPQTYEKAEKRIRERAAGEASIERTELCQLLEAAGISSNNVEGAISRFAALGLITQFTDSAELGDFVVLNPQWLTKGVSQVMEDEQLDQDKGEITHERMRCIWDTQGYQGLYPTLHNCMKEFELCYDMEDKAGCLVPLRFGDARPEIPWSSIPRAKARRVEYKLNITAPKGIMSRFIVKTHHMIVKTPSMPKGVYWQNGVFLRTGEGEYTSEALCQFDPGERTLRIEVRAAFPQNMIEQLHGFAKAVFQFFEGLRPERRYGCVKFEPQEQQCEGVHPEKRILFALSREKPEIDCEQGWHVVDPKRLVFGFSSFGEAALSIEELRHELDKRPAWADGVIKDLASCLVWIDKTHTETVQLREGQERLSAEMAQQIELGMREYLHTFNEMLDDRDFTSAPGVVSIVPADGSSFDPRTWFNCKYVLRPYCESETGVHPVDFSLSFTKSRPWWEKIAPKLALGVKVLSAGLSIGFAGMPLAVGDDLYKTIKNEVTFMKELAGHLELKGGAASDLSDDAGDFAKAVGHTPRHADLRDFGQEDQKRMARQQLAGLLREIAPKNYEARQWGPLRRIHLPDNTYRWLCKEHAELYRR